MSRSFSSLIFTLYSILLVWLFYFSLMWKWKGNKALNGFREFSPSLYKTLHPILYNRFNTIWFDSILIILIFFFYKRYYQTLMYSSYNKAIYSVATFIIWIMIILTLLFWFGYLLDFKFVVVQWS